MTRFFNIEPLHRFSGASAGIRRPKEITCFSYDNQHRYRWDDSSLRYYYPPTMPADLNRGFDTFRPLDDRLDDHLDGLVDTLALYEKQKGTRAEADFITWRGMMTKIMAAPFSPLESWEMNATCFQVGLCPSLLYSSRWHVSGPNPHPSDHHHHANAPLQVISGQIRVSTLSWKG